MLDSKDTGSGSGKILKTVGAITALVGAIAGLVGALTAAGVFDDGDAESTPTVIVQQSERGSVDQQTDQQPDQSSGQSTQAASATSTQVTAIPQPDRSDITLSYLGDAEGCSLGIEVEIADRSYIPTGSSFTASGVPTGVQSYLIAGTIVCPFAGQCDAFGGGTIDVAAGRNYFVQWQNVAIGVCDIALAS